MIASATNEEQPNINAVMNNEVAVIDSATNGEPTNLTIATSNAPVR